MNSFIRLLALLVWAPLTVGASAPPAQSGSDASSASSVVTCALSHPSYSGWCRVTEDLPKGASASKVCRSVLRCLNDVRCTKTYCEASTIRGGWKLESARADPKK